LPRGETRSSARTRSPSPQPNGRITTGGGILHYGHAKVNEKPPYLSSPGSFRGGRTAGDEAKSHKTDNGAFVVEHRKSPLMRRAPTGGLLANREVEVTPLEIDMPSKLDPRLFTLYGLDLPVGAQIRDNVSGSQYGRRMGGQGGRAAGWSCGPRRRRSPRRLLASRGLAAVFRRREEAPSCFRLSSVQFSNTRP